MTSSSKVAPSAAGNMRGHPSQPLPFQPLSLRDRARRALRSFVREESAPSLDEKKDDEEDGEEEEEDVLDACRVLHQEALLLYHTERVREVLRQDPLKDLFAPEPILDDGDSANHSKAQAPDSSAHDRASQRRRQLLEPVFRTAEVLDFDQTVTRDGYVRIDATLRLFATHASANKSSKRRKGRSASKEDVATRNRRVSASTDEDRFVELRFSYERTANMSGDESSPSPTYVSYHIGYCGCSNSNDAKRRGSAAAAASALVGPRQRLLWVNVVAPLGTPSPHGSQLYYDDDDDDDDDSALWSDVESDDANGNKTGRTSGTTMSPDRKRRKKCQPDCPCDDGEDKFLPKTNNATANTETKEEEDDPHVHAKDVFTAGVDPDVLQQLLSELGLDEPALSEDDSAAIFMLMSFPFYEHEWDLVGYVLDAAFGPDNGDDDDEEEESVGE